MKEILCKKTGDSLNLCDSKFSDCSKPIVSEYSPETEAGWQECKECGEFRHYRRTRKTKRKES